MSGETPIAALRTRHEAIAERVAALQVVANRLATGVLSGLHASPFRGGSAEFAEYKEYSPGDDPRTIDWKSVARSDRWFVKRFEETTNRRAFVVLDASASMAFARSGRAQKIDVAAGVLAALATLFLRQGDAVSAHVVGGATTLRPVPPKSRGSQAEAVMALFAQAEPAGKGDLSRGLDDASAEMPPRSLVVVATDLVDDLDRLAGAWRRLFARGHEVVVVQVLDDDEIDFKFAGTLRFRDPEAPRTEVTAEVGAIAESYRKEVAAFLATCEQEATRARAELLRVRTGEDPVPILLRFIARRRAVVRRTAAAR